jgi:hypothetical protein
MGAKVGLPGRVGSMRGQSGVPERVPRQVRSQESSGEPGVRRGAAAEQKVGIFCLPGFVEDRGQICF